MWEDLVGGNTAVVFEKGAAGGGDGSDMFGIPGDFGRAVSLGLALEDTGAVMSSPFCRHFLVFQSWDCWVDS